MLAVSLNSSISNKYLTTNTHYICQFINLYWICLESRPGEARCITLTWSLCVTLNTYQQILSIIIINIIINIINQYHIILIIYNIIINIISNNWTWSDLESSGDHIWKCLRKYIDSKSCHVRFLLIYYMYIKFILIYVHILDSTALWVNLYYEFKIFSCNNKECIYSQQDKFQVQKGLFLKHGSNQNR